MVQKIEKQKGLLDISTPKDLLLTLSLAGGILSAMAVSPVLLAAAIPLAQAIKKQDKKKIRKAQKTISYLKKQGYIKIAENKTGANIKLTKPGRDFIMKHEIEHQICAMSDINGTQKWDKKWRILIYDVQSSNRLKRDALRHFIKKMHMHQLQKSVWVYPFDCQKQVDFLKDTLALSEKELRLIIAESIGSDSSLRKRFDL